ncbi:uncharacterized protein LOC100175962 [Ciona intestinalis]
MSQSGDEADCYEDNINYDEAFKTEDAVFIPNIKPTELHERFQQFVRSNNASRNNSIDWEKGNSILEELSSSFASETRFSSQTTDSSLSEDEVNEIVRKNKNLQQQVKELKEKDAQMFRQVELAEDETERLRTEQAILQYELKNCQELMKGREKLHIEVGQLQLDLDKVMDEKAELESEVRRFKKEEEVTLMTMLDLRDQNDELNANVIGLRDLNNELLGEKMMVQLRCEAYEAEMKEKDNEIDQKLMLYQEVKEQAEDYKAAVQNLKEEKANLINQFHEMQLEVSVYHKHNIQGDSPGNEKMKRRSECMFNLQSELASAYNMEGELNSKSEKENFSSLNSSNVETPVVNQENETQTDNLSLVEVLVQTDIDDNSLMKLTEEIESFKVEVLQKDGKLEELISELDFYKSKSAYLASQIDLNRSRTQELIDMHNVEMDDLAQLTDMFHHEVKNSILETEENLTTEIFEENFVPIWSSQLLDALDLKNCGENGKISSNPSSQLKNAENLQIAFKKLVKNCSVLGKCKDFVQLAINKKIETIQNLIHNDIDHSDDSVVQDLITKHFNSVVELTHRVDWYSHTLGNLQSSCQMQQTIKELFVRETQTGSPQNCKICAKDSGLSITEEQSIIEISPHLQSLLQNPNRSSKFAQALIPSRLSVFMLFALLTIAKICHKYFSSFSRTGLLCIIFFMCALFSVDLNVDYKVDPIF